MLFLEEEDVLWMMCALIEDLLPPSYFSSTLLGVQTDQRVLRQLIVQYLPALDRLLQEHDIGKGRQGRDGACVAVMNGRSNCERGQGMGIKCTHHLVAF